MFGVNFSAGKLFEAEVDGYCFLQLSQVQHLSSRHLRVSFTSLSPIWQADFDYLGYTMDDAEMLQVLQDKVLNIVSDPYQKLCGQVQTIRTVPVETSPLHRPLCIHEHSPDLSDELIYGRLIVVGYSEYRKSSQDEYVPVGIANESLLLKRRY
jgi:hypothetical protein